MKNDLVGNKKRTSIKRSKTLPLSGASEQLWNPAVPKSFEVEENRTTDWRAPRLPACVCRFLSSSEDVDDWLPALLRYLDPTTVAPLDVLPNRALAADIREKKKSCPSNDNDEEEASERPRVCVCVYYMCPSAFSHFHPLVTLLLFLVSCRSFYYGGARASAISYRRDDAHISSVCAASRGALAPAAADASTAAAAAQLGTLDGGQPTLDPAAGRLIRDRQKTRNPLFLHGKGDGAVRFGIKKPKEGKDQEEFSSPQKNERKEMRSAYHSACASMIRPLQLPFRRSGAPIV
ncbi:hypothetical protein DAPPUDRAFT_238167 [Daphnia pulex]|uniref:Uncharacterized protein n=1 Tax=Daphnia pulex TaxID=6669 RepID=E9G6T7_DAPPU|nr:hypothetical protein DAPPUDRAFT_238167 [Daphnia pulex]|eukprot:EFX84802.1 hypothetical protein DAPPUDRAFT_238167 [Daphnia pulex]